MTLLSRSPFLGSAALAAVTALSPSAAAQDARPPAEPISVLQRMQQSFAPQGIRSGSALIEPSGSLDLSYDSNVLARHRVGPDFVASAQPTLEIRSELPKQSFGLKAQGEIRQYAVHTSENQVNGSVGGNGRADIAPNAYFVGAASYQRLHEDRGALVPASGIRPTPYGVASGTAGFVIEPAPMGLRLDAGVDAYSFENVTGTLGPINETARNRIVYSLAPRLSYVIVPQYDAFIRAVVNRRQYDRARLPDGLDRNSSGAAADLGIALDAPGLALGELYLGYLRQAYDQRGLRPIQAVDFGANLLWSPAAATSVRLNIARSVEESTLPGSPGYLQTAIRLAIEQEVMRDIVALGSAGFIRADFSPGNGATNIYELALGARYFLGERMSAGVEYVLRHRSATAALPGYTRQIVGLRLRGQL